MVKVPVTIRIEEDLKEELQKESIERKMNLSQVIIEKIEGNSLEEKELEVLKEQLKISAEQLADSKIREEKKDELLNGLNKRLEESQKLVDQQQQLQLRAEKRNELLENEKQLLLEQSTQKQKKWFKFWN